MAEYLEIVGGNPLSGKVKVGGAKNAVLPMAIASLLTDKKVVLNRIPAISDVGVLVHLLESLGAEATYTGDSLSLQSKEISSNHASYSLVKALRASFWILAPLLARTGQARVALPGGDIIGARPVDIHLDALRQMGAEIKLQHGVVIANAPHGGLRPANIEFRFPSVGATHQILMAAALVEGTTTIKGAAREPEVVALCNLLTCMGVKIEGIGTSYLTIQGSKKLGGTTVEVIGDRIEAATYLMAAISSRGSITVEGISPAFLSEPLDLMANMGVKIISDNDSISIDCFNPPKAVSIVTGPFPKFATDLQALFMATLCTAEGNSVIEEHVFEGRFGHVAELSRMGAKIKIIDGVAIIEGVKQLSGALVEGLDIRAAASLVIAALGAEGVSHIQEIGHLRRGYQNLENNLRNLGGVMRVIQGDPDDFLYVGC
jgi:UDP-N-acetylglucosamine 1-carboxyvinyltransferase